MPIYTFTCQLCGKESEELLKIADLEKVDGDEPLRCKAVVQLRVGFTSFGILAPDAPAREVPDSVVCDGRLQRAEVEMTALTPYAWRP